PGLVVRAEVGAHDAGVQGGGRDAAAGEAAGQLGGEQDVGELGLAVGARSGVVASALQVVERDPALRLGAGGDGDAPCGGAGREPLQEQGGEQERGQVVEGERALQAVGGQVAVGPEPADVVDQHVQPRVGGEDRAGEPPDLDLGAQV